MRCGHTHSVKMTEKIGINFTGAPRLGPMDRVQWLLFLFIRIERLQFSVALKCFALERSSFYWLVF
jgi:hypothetical protein